LGKGTILIGLPATPDNRVLESLTPKGYALLKHSAVHCGQKKAIKRQPKL